MNKSNLRALEVLDRAASAIIIPDRKQPAVLRYELNGVDLLTVSIQPARKCS